MLLLLVAAGRQPTCGCLIAASLLRRVVKGLAIDKACATVTVQLGVVAQQAAACPDITGTAAFAVPLTVGAGASTQPASLLVSSAGRQWRQMVSLRDAAEVHIDMQDAHVVAPAPKKAAPTCHATAAAASTPAPTISCPACPRRSCTQLEEVDTHSMPTFLFLAALPAPTSLAHSPPAEQTALPLPPALALSAGPPSLLLPGLAAACAAQAVALAFLLLRQHGSGESQSAGAADGNTSAPSEDGAAASPRRPARRLSLRDACTSPLVILASPFVGTKRQAAEAAAALDSIAEDRDEGALAAAEPTAMEPQQDGWQRQAASARQTAAHASLPTPPNGWTR